MHKHMDWELYVGEQLDQVVDRSRQFYPVLADDMKLQELALFHKALGDETRLKIIGMLLVKDVCLCEITDGLKVPASTINHHLKILERGGLILSKRNGKFTVYALDERMTHRLPFDKPSS